MSYTLQLWDKPADWPWPATKAEADTQFERVSDSPPTQQNPKFLEWGRAMHAGYPESLDVWLDGSEDGVTDDATLGFGINTRSPHWDAAFDHAWAHATQLGLNLYDPQSGVHYLGNGDVPEEPDLQVREAVRAREKGDDATAWAGYRRWAARGNVHAIYALGRAMRFGILGQRRHFDLAAVLQVMGAHDAQTRQDAQAFHDRFAQEDRPRLQALHARLTAARGDQLLRILDDERRAVDEAFARTEQKMLYTRKRLEALDDLKAVALQGHEVAAYQHALESVIGWEEPAYDMARYWCLRAAEWDHEPAKRLLAVMHERGWGGPVDQEQAAKWHASAKAQQQENQAAQRHKEEAASPGGLSLAPLVPTAPDAAPVQWTGSLMRDFAGWFAREGNPHAAFQLGLCDEHGRDGGPVNLAQARAWYAQAAEAGHADATYNLGVFIEAGKGGAKDALAAKALFMLANTRGTTMQVADLRISPQEQGPVRALVQALREPGHLREVLRARGLGSPAPAAAPAGLSATGWGRAGAGVPRPAELSQGAAPRAPRNPAADEDNAQDHGGVEGGTGRRGGHRSGAAADSGFSLHLGHAALAIGVANVVLLIALVKPGASFRMGMAVLGLVAAFGAWRTARDFDWSVPARAVVAGLAAVPVLGMAVCLGLLFKAARERQ